MNGKITSDTARALIRGQIKYAGEWKDNKRHGQGTFTFPNGKKIIAEYENDKRIKPQAVGSPEKKITNFKRTIVCKNKYNIVNLFKFKDNKVVTFCLYKVLAMCHVKIKNIIEYIRKFQRYKRKYTFDLKYLYRFKYNGFI